MSKKSRLEVLREATLAATTRKGPTCGACQLTPEDLGFVVEMRGQSPSVPYTAIAKGLEAVGLNIKPSILSRHFRENHGS